MGATAQELIDLLDRHEISNDEFYSRAKQLTDGQLRMLLEALLERSAAKGDSSPDEH